MTYVVGEACIKCKYTDCVAVCPVDCFYEGANSLVINPDECIDCGVCEPECPVDAIFVDRKARGDDGRTAFVEDSRNFFTIVLPGRDAPLGNPGGSRKVGELGVDTPFVEGL